MDKDMQPKRLQEYATMQLNKQTIRTYWKKVSRLLPESSIYGCGKLRYFEEFHLATNDDISQINVRCGYLIDGIQVEYRRGSAGKFHGGTGGRSCTFTLLPDEKIIAVRDTLYKSYGWRQVARLEFETDRGKKDTFGEYAGDDTFAFEMKDGAYLAAIKGYDRYEGDKKKYPGWTKAHQLLPAIGFIAKY